MFDVLTLIKGMNKGYADQPYCIVRRSDGGWLCTATHNPTTEGGFGEAVYTSISLDQGETWTKAAPLEDQSSLPLQERAAYAYSTLFETKLSSSRIYNIFVQNYQNVTLDRFSVSSESRTESPMRFSPFLRSMRRQQRHNCRFEHRRLLHKPPCHESMT